MKFPSFGHLPLAGLCMLLAAAWALVPSGRAAEGDLAGSKDAPFLSRYEGAVITAYSQKEFDAYTLPLGPMEEGKPKTSNQLEGRVTRVTYKAPANRSALEVFRNYEKELQNRKFEILFRAAGVELEGFEALYQDLSGPPAYGGTRPLFLSAKLSRPEGDLYVALYVAGCSQAFANDEFKEGQPFVQLETVEVQPMEKKMVPAGH